jgi:N-acetylmuramoyl-L-alanine amidase
MEDLDTRDPPLNDRPSRRVLLPLAIVLALVGLAVGNLASQAPAPSLTMLSKDGRRAIALTLVNGQEYVGLDDLTPIFQLTVREDALGAVTVSYKGRSIILTADQALVSVGGRLISLPAPATRAGRRWLVPVEFINRALASIYDTGLDLRKTSHLLIVGDLRVPRVTVRYDVVAPGGRVTIDATPRATSTVTQENDRLTIKFDADALDIANPPLAALPAQGLVQGVHLVDATTLSVDVGRVASFRATSQPIDTTTRLTIDVAAPTAETTSPAAAAGVPAPPPAAVDVPSLTNPAPAIRTIAIDPGHGGMDEGVKTADGIKEKDLTLAVARRIKAAIEGRLGIRVLLTREDDRDLPLDDRAAVANNNKADLFISLHANASLRRAASGATIYYAAFDQAAQPAPGATPARVPTFGGGARDIELVAWDQAQTRHLDQSAAFAAVLEGAFHDRVPLGAHAIERAPLGVLASANMPAVLVEMGLLSNPEQAKRLVDAEFQNTLVQAVTDAVIKYRDSLEGAAR